MINEKDFNNKLTIIKNSGEAFAQNIHEAGLMAIEYSILHGDVGFGARLMEALGKKHDAKRVERWLCHFGKFGMKQGKLVFRKRGDLKSETLEAHMGGANAMPYWELTPQTHYKMTFDYLSILRSAIKQHEKAEKMKNEGKEVDEKNIAVLEQMKEVFAKFDKKSEPVAI